MEIQLPPELQVQLETFARLQDKDPVVVAMDLLKLGLEQQEQIARKKREIGARLESRLEDYYSGRSVPIDGEDVFERLRRRSNAKIAEYGS